jgi:hypothetical protein
MKIFKSKDRILINNNILPRKDKIKIKSHPKILHHLKNTKNTQKWKRIDTQLILS